MGNRTQNFVFGHRHGLHGLEVRHWATEHWVVGSILGLNKFSIVNLGRTHFFEGLRWFFFVVKISLKAYCKIYQKCN